MVEPHAPGNFRILANSTLEAVRGQSAVVIPAGETRELVLLMPPNATEIDPENRLECEVYWRYAQPKIWQVDRRIRVSIPKRSLMIMDAARYDPTNWQDD